MKIVRDGEERLQVITGNYLLPGWLILLGVLGVFLELHDWSTGKLHITDFQSATPIIAATLALLVGLALFRRYTCRFDRSQQRAVWRSIGLLGVRTSVVPFSQIERVDFEIDPNNFTNSHPQWGPSQRLVLVTKGASLPFSDMYMTCGSKEREACDAINAFLGHIVRIPSLEDKVRSMIASGQFINAIAYVRYQRQCGIAEAKDFVEKLR